jgi:hypothetical protein
VRRGAAHLKLENPRFLFLEGWGCASATPADASVAAAGTSSDAPAAGGSAPVLMVDYRIKVHMDLQTDNSLVVVK